MFTAFQSNTGVLGINTNGTRSDWADTGLGMAAGTSPSIAPIMAPPSRPTIDSFLPKSGNAGTPVVIHGSNFRMVTAVKFNGIPSNYTIVSADTINALVPTPASSGPMSVVTASGIATSATSFLVSGASGGIGSLSFSNNTKETVITIWVIDRTTGDDAGETLSLNKVSQARYKQKVWK